MSNINKNILLLSPFFFPEPISTGKLNSDLAIALSEKGHQVTVLCFHPFYPSWNIERSKSKLKNIKIVRGGKYLFFTKMTVLRRIILELSYAFFVIRKLWKYNKNIDIIIPVFPPSFAFLLIIPFLNKRTKKIGMVHDLQEIYSSVKKGFLNKLINFCVHKVDKKCLVSCDKLIFLSEEMKNEAKKMYSLNTQSLHVQYPFHTIQNKITNNLADILDKRKINIVYSGALGEKQNPKGLLDFFQFASSKIENAFFYIFSQGTVFEKLKIENTNSKIKFHSLVKRENLEELYARSDLQVVPQLQNTSKGSLPSKLPNLLASGCKVLIITDKNSEIEKLFFKYNFQTVVTTWNHNALLEALKAALSNHSNKRHQIEFANQLFTIDKMMSKIIS